MQYKNIIARDTETIGVIVKGNKHTCHKHLAKVIIISSNYFIIKIGAEVIQTSGIIVNGNIEHEMYYEDKSVVIYIDCLSAFAKCLDYLYLHGNSYYILPINLLEKLILYLDANDINSMRKIFDREICKADILHHIQGAEMQDSRIVEAINIIAELGCLTSDIADYLANQCNLSKSRFLHLFRECTGVSFKNYVYNKRMEKTLIYTIEENLTMTNAAIKAGFSTGNHFSYAFQKNYGISFKSFMRVQ